MRIEARYRDLEGDTAKRDRTHSVIEQLHGTSVRVTVNRLKQWTTYSSVVLLSRPQEDRLSRDSV